MSKRLGTNVTPSLALLRRHILWNQRHRTALFRRERSSGDTPRSRELALAQLAELIAWLGWLRSSELFGLKWTDIVTCPPHNHKQFDLPTGVGAVLLRLLESTKTSQNKTVDVVIAWQTSLGLCIGEWMLICRSLHPPHLSPFIFQDNNGDRWTSTTFRHKFLIPLLEYQRLEGDPYLTPYDGTTPGFSISHIFYSLYSYRQGGRSDAPLKRM